MLRCLTQMDVNLRDIPADELIVACGALEQMVIDAIVQLKAGGRADIARKLEDRLKDAQACVAGLVEKSE